MSASILEAMAFRLPVLATRVGGSPEVIEDGINGWLYQPNDLAALIEALGRVATTDRETLTQFGAAAALRVGCDQSRAEALARMTKVLTGLAEGRTPRPLVPQTANGVPDE